MSGFFIFDTKTILSFEYVNKNIYVSTLELLADEHLLCMPLQCNS